MESSPITAKDSIPPWERDRSIVRPVASRPRPVVTPQPKVTTKKKKKSKRKRKRDDEQRRIVRLQALADMPYGEYLLSPEWKAKRKKVIARSKGKCEECGNMVNLEVHHVRYSRRGLEPLTDLKCVCRGCHSIHHEDKYPAQDEVSKEFRNIASWF